MPRHLFDKAAFQKAWLSASMVIGTLGILRGAYLATRSNAGSVAGIVGGGAMVLIGYVGLRGLGKLAHSGDRNSAQAE